MCLLPGLAHALEPGDRLAPWTLLDQHERPYTLTPDTRVLLVARDMQGAKLIKAALAEQPVGYLEARGAVFVADIERMPTVISTLFAIPAMRGYAYRVMLDRQGRVAERYAVPDASVRLMRLDHGTLVAQETYVDAEALKQALDASPTSP
ncbi:FAD/FMN-containing dehydrogenase [Pseudomonas alabamensis]|uniref:FAD/FMN-containing dehydrogenase n=1 Tax=Pseudomonas alabamensis TaxID=3064349 RepID=UPI003F653A6A